MIALCEQPRKCESLVQSTPFLRAVQEAVQDLAQQAPRPRVATCPLPMSLKLEMGLVLLIPDNHYHHLHHPALTTMFQVAVSTSVGASSCAFGSSLAGLHQRSGEIRQNVCSFAAA